MIAEFSIWKPENTKFKGVIVLTAPSQYDGRKDIYIRAWRQFAKKHKCALVGCFFQDEFPSGIEEYADATLSGQRLIDFLKQEVGEGDERVIPKIFLFGFSAGGQFNYEFAVRYPALVGAFVVNKGGIYYTALAPPATRAIPGLFILGAKDADWRIAILNGIWAVNRVAGADWGRVIEPCSHDLCDSEDISMQFFKKVLTRMP